MTEDELMQLIIKADPRLDVPELYAISGVEYRHFERFADLVAAAEREACAQIVETLWAVPNNGMATEEQAYGERCAGVIRARGQKQ